MGQGSSSSSPSNGFLPKELIFQSRQSHPAYGNITIYHDPLSFESFALCTLRKDNKSLNPSFLLKLQQYHLNVSNDHLIRLLRYESAEQSEFCSHFTRVTMLFDFFPHTLDSELLIRKQQNESFLEIELVHILISLLSALESLKLQDVNYSDLTPETILLSRSGLVKLTPIDELTGMSRFAKFIVGSKNANYLSPEMLQLKKLAMKEQWKDVDNDKENVFSLGMILLEALTFSRIGDFYDLTNLEVKYSVLEKVLIESNGSENFKFLLRRMLDPDPANRPSYQDLLGELNEFRENFLGIKLHCYSVKEAVDNEEKFIVNQNAENQKNISIFNEDNPEIPGPENYGFSSYVGPESAKLGTPLLNLQEIGHNDNKSRRDFAQNQRELVDISWFRSHVEQLYGEGLAISEEIQRKYQIATNKKAIFPDDYDGQWIQSALILNPRKENNTPKAGTSLLRRKESSTSLNKDYHYFPKIGTFTISPMRRDSNLQENNRNSVQNMIKNFDYNLNNNASPAKERLEKKKAKMTNSTPKKKVSLDSKNDKKYYTPKREAGEKMKLKNSGSVKKASFFKERPVTPSYESLYWEALKKKF